MSLHDRIAKLKITKESDGWPTGERIIYKTGFVDAREEAAKLASAADELMVEMAEILECCGMGMVCHNRARSMVKKYNDWKEPTK